MIKIINDDDNVDSFYFLYNIYDVDKILSNILNKINISIKEYILYFYKNIHKKYTKKYVLESLQNILKDINNNKKVNSSLK